MFIEMHTHVPSTFTIRVKLQFIGPEGADKGIIYHWGTEY